MWRSIVATLASGAAIAAMAGSIPGASHAGTGASGVPLPNTRLDQRSDGPVSGEPARKLSPGGAHLSPIRRIDCRRWQTLASQLGETIAGRRMRQTATGEVCRQHGEETLAWDWPWMGAALSTALPPQVVFETGAWEVRCDGAGRRRRCALVHQAVMGTVRGKPAVGQVDAALTDVGTGRGSVISTHFIIDMIAGRESVLWRVFIPAEPPEALTTRSPEAGATQGADPAAPAVTPHVSATQSGHNAARASRLHILGDRADKSDGPGYCSAAGCLIEAGPKRSAEIANRLADGGAVQLRIDAEDSGPRTTFVISANGFGASFKELVRHRREEERQRR